MKLSIGSFKLLDFDSCHMLGTFLSKRNINVVLSQTVDHAGIHSMFRILDSDGNGYLDSDEFAVAYDIFRHHVENSNNFYGDNNNSIKIIDDTDSQSQHINREEDDLRDAMFKSLAIRRIKKRDRVYFRDFWNAFTAYDIHEKFHISNINSSFDITEIEFPCHFISQYLVSCLQNFFWMKLNKENEKKSNQESDNAIDVSMLIEFPVKLNEWNETLNENLTKLYHFGIGFGYHNQLLPDSNQSVLFTNLLAKNVIDELKRRFGNEADSYDVDKILQLNEMFLLKLFKDLIDLLPLRHHVTLVANCKITGSMHGQMSRLIDFDGDILDLCLACKQYYYFVIVLNAWMRSNNMNDENIESVSRKLKKNKFADDKMLISMLKYAVSDPNIDVDLTQFLLPICFEKQRKEKNETDEQLGFQIIELIKAAVCECLRPSESM